MAFFLELYGDLVVERPILTQICTAGFMSIFADILAQQVVEKKSFSHDVRRTLIMAICGFFYFGPIVSCWLTFLVARDLPAFVNVLLDQFLATPPLLSGFLILHTLLNSQGKEKIKHRLTNELPEILKTNWMVWIPAQFITFQLVPTQYRMLFIQLVSLFWTCYLSSKTSSNSERRLDKENLS